MKLDADNKFPDLSQFQSRLDINGMIGELGL